MVTISLPVRIFEPRSTIERICDCWGFSPIYLRMACNTQDKLERFKLIISNCMSGLSISISNKKPFNPILGETY